jgi:hypothetical protein
MQQDYVNKEEFYTLDSYVRDGFEGLGKQIDFVEKNLGDKIDTVDSKVTNINLDLHSLAGDVSWIKRSMTELVKKI